MQPVSKWASRGSDNLTLKLQRAHTGLQQLEFRWMKWSTEPRRWSSPTSLGFQGDLGMSACMSLQKAKVTFPLQLSAVSKQN